MQVIALLPHHVHRLARHRPTSLVAFTAAGAVVVLATFLPWLESGSTSRSSYDLLGLVGRLDIAPNGVVTMLIRWWPLVPLIVTVAVVLAWWRLWVPSLVAAMIGVCYAGGVGGALVVGADGTPITVGIGPAVCAGASIVFLFTSVWMVFTYATERAARRPSGAPRADPS